MDPQPLMEKKVVATARGSFAQDGFLDWEATLTITHALVTSLITSKNHYSVLYMRLPLKTIQKLQLVQNAAAILSVL